MPQIAGSNSCRVGAPSCARDARYDCDRAAAAVQMWESQLVFSVRTPRWRLLLVAVAGLVGLTIAACSTARGPMSTDDATPDQVVRAYADAVHAGDCQTAAALVDDRRQSWCGSVDITGLTVSDRTQERKETESGNGPMIERVWVTLRSRGGDVSLPDGEHMWSYLLDRTGPNGAWRIYDQGMG